MRPFCYSSPPAINIIYLAVKELSFPLGALYQRYRGNEAPHTENEMQDLRTEIDVRTDTLDDGEKHIRFSDLDALEKVFSSREIKAALIAMGCGTLEGTDKGVLY